MMGESISTSKMVIRSWNPGWKPTKTKLDAYECRHGLGYTQIRGELNGLKSEVLYFVPLGFWGEVQKVSSEKHQH
jgi:cellobiose phosphorylase